MAGIATAIIAAGIIGGGASIYAASKQSQAAQNAINAQQGMFNQAQGQFTAAEQLQQPFISAGTEAAGTLSSLLKPGADMTSILKNIPGMQFLQQLTQQGVSNQATTTGLSGNTLLAGANAGSNIALSAGWQPIVNSLQGLVNSGVQSAGSVQGGAAALGGQAVQTGANVGQNLVGIGNAQAGAATSVGANLGNSLTSAALFSRLLNNQNMYGTGQQGAINSGAQPGVSNGGYNFLDAAAP